MREGDRRPRSALSEHPELGHLRTHAGSAATAFSHAYSAFSIAVSKELALRFVTGPALSLAYGVNPEGAVELLTSGKSSSARVRRSSGSPA